MGMFKRTRFTTSDTNEDFWIYEPTIYKKGAYNIKGKEHTFTKKIKI